MSVLSKLRSALSPSRGPSPPAVSWRDLLTPIGVAGPICPHCGHVFEKMPQRKRACPSCCGVFHSRKRPLDGAKVLLTEPQALEGEGQSALVGFAQEGVADAALNAIVRVLHEELHRMPTAEEVVEHQLISTAVACAEGWQWGLYRNARFNLAESCVRRGLREEALKLYLEVCLVDLNGPRNCGTRDTAITSRFPPFDPSNAFLAPGVVNRAKDVADELQVPEPALERLFEDLGKNVGAALGLPRSAGDAWRELAVALRARSK